ncbi:MULTISPECIES: hypothetical protein [Methylobacterium]|uniref:Uncharacterized protein n=1 Tax=Methylobacterium bullatum TaxID=570505 RepID=A0A679K1A4_9HYPH|nr:hypothetical protein [Methylobacterium sp. Leaf85]CAA2140754.1 hypothetical protein MBLL_02284 [Methylobacterium bullatum]
MMGSGIRGLSIVAVTAAMAMVPAIASAESAGKPANICKELTAFLHPPAQPAASGSATAQTSTAVTAPGSGSQKPSGSETQKDSGLSGPTASNGPGASGPQGATQNTAAPSGASAQAPAPAAAPAAPAAPPPKTPSAAFIEQGDAAAGANDIAGCQRVARMIRRDGVVMPSPLMSLAALDLKYLEAAR